MKKIYLSLLAAVSILGVVAAPAYAASETNRVHIIEATPQQKPNLFSWFFTKRLYAGLSDDQEIPQPGNSNAFGSTTVRLYPNQSKLCVNMRVWSMDSHTAAHIHQASKGANGPVVVILPTPDGSGRADACVEVDSEKLREIQSGPSNFYINVHSEQYPSGAIRGQLMQ